jgi:hypothetical protein
MYNTKLASMVKSSNHTQKDTTVNTVWKTNDYSRFKILGGNRQLNELHLKRLQSSIMEKNLLFANPILVNHNFEIIDGQHRFAICRELSLPIHYLLVENLGLPDVQTLNANAKNWKIEDYVDGYCDMGLSEYCYLKTQMDKTKLGVTILLAIFASGGLSGNSIYNLKDGNLNLTYKNRGLILLKWIEDWTKYYEGADRRTFVLALVQLYDIKGYNHDKMMQKMQYQSTKLVDCTTTKTYLALLEEIYNFRERGEKLRFF